MTSCFFNSADVCAASDGVHIPHSYFDGAKYFQKFSTFNL